VAWSSAAISAGEQAAYLADKPLLIGTNAAESYSNAAKWVGWTSGGRDYGQSSDTTCTQADEPTAWTHNRSAAERSGPSAVASARGYALIFELDGTVDFDSIVLANHNFAAVTAAHTATVDVWIADDGSFGAAPRRIARWSSSLLTGPRLVSYDLNDLVTPGAGVYARFSGVTWLQVAVYAASTVATLPKIGEVWLGRRRQLGEAPWAPWDADGYESDVVDAYARSGAGARVVRSSGGRVWRPRWTSQGTDDPHGLSIGGAVRTWWTSDLEHGSKAGVWVPQPYSAGNQAHLVLPSPSLRLPQRPASLADVELELRELAPYRSGEG